MAPFQDPWDWSIDDVVEALCKSRALWEGYARDLKLPDATIFEQSIRENDINGSTLLRGLDKAVLKDELGIKSIGQRDAILYAIENLQGQSLKYANHSGAAASRHQLLVGDRFRVPFSQQVLSPSLEHETAISQAHQSAQNDTATRTAHIAGPHDQPEDVGKLSHPLPHEPSADNEHDRKRRKLTLVSLQRPASAAALNTESVGGRQEEQGNSAITEGVKTREVASDDVVAGNGMVRRGSVNIADHPSSEGTIQEAPEYGVLKKVAKRVKPTALTTTSLLNPQIDHVYLGSHKRPVAGFFAGPLIITSDSDSEEDLDLEFAGAGPEGESCYAYRRVHHFLRRPVVEESHDGSSTMTVIQPYPLKKGFFVEGEAPPRIHFKTDGNKASVGREGRIAVALNSSSERSSNHDWDFLNHWGNTDDPSEPLPVYGESGSEIDVSDGFLEELEEEQREAAANATQKRIPLATDTVLEIIKRSINAQAEAWRTKKLPLREHNKAWSVWRKARTHSGRDALIATAKSDIASLHQRLEKLKVSIAQEVWHKEANVVRQCAICEETVWQLEEHSWKISVWQRPTAPARNGTKIKVKRKTASVHASDEEGITLDSEPEKASGSDMGDFIQIDEADVPHHIGLTANQRKLETLNHDAPPEQALSLPYGTADKDMDIDRAESDENEGPSVQEDAAMSDEPVPADNVSRESSELFVGEAKTEPETRHSPNPTKKDKPSTIVDLTGDGESSDEPIVDLTTPKDDSLYDGLPEQATDEQIAAWSWRRLEERQDRKRIVIKIVRSIQKAQFSAIRRRLQGLKQRNQRDFQDELKRTLTSISKDQTRPPGMLQQDYDLLYTITKLFMCWIHASYRYWTMKTVPSSAIAETRQECLKNIQPFTTLLMFIVRYDLNPIRATFPRFKDFNAEQKPSEALLTSGVSGSTTSPPHPLLVDSESDEVPPEQETPAKVRRRIVKDKQAMNKRLNAQARMQSQVDRSSQLKTVLGHDMVDGDRGIIVNPEQPEENAYIYIDPHSEIARAIKPHQVDGVQFMWREIVSAAKDEGEMNGCVLAHTMGLGKTMQAITLLVTVSQAARSTNPTISSQIPAAMKHMRALIISPASLINNWEAELFMWAPKPRYDNIGDIRRIDAELSPAARPQVISEWHEHGGVLIISYNLLQQLVANTRNTYTPEQHKVLERQLLDGPNLIVADEAHTFKSLDSRLSKAVNRFKSKSRIALTGSPLANHLLEYFALIDWVSPGYLGNVREFRYEYKDPIEEGLYKDSNAYKRRKALKRLEVLKRELDPKINRKDITVLRGSLRPKLEFVVTVSLTAIQEKAYRAYVRSLLKSGGADASNASLWSWLAVLQLLCNHPKAFISKLQASDKSDKATPTVKKQGRTSKVTVEAQIPASTVPSTAINDAEDEPGEEAKTLSQVDIDQQSVTKLGITEEMVAEQKQILGSVDYSCQHSHKMQVFMTILKHAKRVGDRVLVFTHSIPTLNVLEETLKTTHYNYARLDGTTKMSNRQNMANAFNTGEIEVFLISTRAGGQGFNLPGANRVIIFDFQFNPAWEEQAIGRAYRIGQEKAVFVYRLIVGGTFEPVIYNKAVFKTQLAYNVVEKKNTVSQAVKNKDFLFEPKEIEQQDLKEFIGKDCSILDKLLLGEQKDVIRAIQTTETLQEEATDDLTAEEQKEVEDMWALEQLKKKKDPQEYERQLRAYQERLMKNRPLVVHSSARPSITQTPVPSSAPVGVPRLTDPHSINGGTVVGSASSSARDTSKSLFPSVRDRAETNLGLHKNDSIDTLTGHRKNFFQGRSAAEGDIAATTRAAWKLPQPPALRTPFKYASKRNGTSESAQAPGDAQIATLDNGPRHRSAPSSPAANNDAFSLPEGSNDMLPDDDNRTGRPTSSGRSRAAAQSAPAQKRSLTASAPAPNPLHSYDNGLSTPVPNAHADTPEEHPSTEMVTPPEYPIDEPLENLHVSSSPTRRLRGGVRSSSPDPGVPQSPAVSGRSRRPYTKLWPERS